MSTKTKLLSASMYVVKVGDIDRAKEQLDELSRNGNAAAHFAIAMGGIDKAKKALKRLEKKMDRGT